MIGGSGPTEYVIHQHPVWRDRADHIVNVDLDHGLSGKQEQLWTRLVGADEVEICCIPFFAYDLSLGDIAVIDANGLVGGVARRSGRHVFRIIVDEYVSLWFSFPGQDAP